jgi:hypothetical protein
MAFSTHAQGLLREHWSGITGTSVSNLTSNPNYPNNPTSQSIIPSFEGPINLEDNYGDRIRGYIIPPTTGSYTFWIASDDNSELWLSTSSDPAGKVLIASVPEWTNSREWTKFPSQQSASVTLTAGQKYYVEVLHKDWNYGDNIAVGWQGPGITGDNERPIPGSRLVPFNAGLLREVWTGISGTTVANLTSNGNYPNTPNVSEKISTFETSTNYGDSYGQRLRGYVVPPTTGDYTFWISSDDNSELWLSTSADPAAKSLIASVTGFTSVREWTKYSSQQSAVKALTAGQKYYIEVLHKDGTGNDNCAVGWQGPGITGDAERPIPENRLLSWDWAGSGQTYTLTLNATHGSITANPPGPSYTANTVVSLTPNPDAGYSFDNWSGDLTGSSNPGNITMSSTKTVTTVYAAHAPTDMSLSPSSIAENQSANTPVGIFSAQDIDVGSTFTFSLVSGTGDVDNGSFGLISGNQLVTTQAFDYETKNSYSIRVRVDDNTGMSFEKQFTVTVTDQNEYSDPTPTPAAGSELDGAAITISWTAVQGATSYDLDVGTTLGGTDLFNGTAGTSRSVNVTGLPVNGSTIYVRITTVDVGGSHTFDYTYVAYTDIPRAQNVFVAGVAQVGQIVTGAYTYQDADPEGTSTYRWFRADDANGTNQVAISGATAITYTLTTDDQGKYIRFEVTPIAQTGVINGLATLSPIPLAGPVGSPSGPIYVYPEVCGAGESMIVDGSTIISGDLTARRITALEVVVTPKWQVTGPAPDYVFEKDYNLTDLQKVKEFVETNKHLEGVPSAKDMEKGGVNIVEINMALLKKIEELTLYTIQLKSEIDKQRKDLESIRNSNQ